MMCLRFRERTLLTVRSQIPKIAFSFICRRLLSDEFVKKNENYVPVADMNSIHKVPYFPQPY